MCLNPLAHIELDSFLRFNIERDTKFKSTSSYRARLISILIKQVQEMFKSTSSYRARPQDVNDLDNESLFKSTSSYRARQQKCIEFKLM